MMTDLLNSNVNIFLLFSFGIVFFAFITTVGSPFLLISVVLSILRTAIGVPQTPPNFVVYGVAMLLTSMIMYEPLKSDFNLLNQNVYQIEQDSSLVEKIHVIDRSFPGYKEFMYTNTENNIFEDRKSEACQSYYDKCNVFELLPGYAMSEINKAFIFGFKIFLPFLVIDFLVSVILLSLGMMMSPPSAFSMPIKLGFFFYVDGWGWLVENFMRLY